MEASLSGSIRFINYSAIKKNTTILMFIWMVFLFIPIPNTFLFIFDELTFKFFFMKKLLLFLVLIPFISFSQTEKIEKDNLAKRYADKEFSAETYGHYGSEWRRIMEEIGGYPSLPYDEASGQIKFNFIKSTEQTKQVNYNRILEWAAINFGALSSVLHYEDFESGKIVIKGWFDVTHKNEYKNYWGKSKEGVKTTKCFQTYIFTIKDSKIKAEIVDVRYIFKFHGYYSNSAYIPESIFELSIHDYYPITNFETKEWKEKLDLLKQTNIRIENIVTDISNYIKAYSDDYTF